MSTAVVYEGVKIESVQWPGVFLRMDGKDLTKFDPKSGGVVNAQQGAGPWEVYTIKCSDGVATIESSIFPGRYLRMDGKAVKSFNGAGSGKVDVQYEAHAFEKFKIYTDPFGVSTIESAHFPGVFLRLDGSGVTKPVPSGAGVVNCQYGAFEYEKFRLHNFIYKN